MIPYIDIPPLELGPLKLYPFGFLVGIAIIVGTVMTGRRARRCGLDERVAADLTLWAVIPGFIGAHLYSVIFYFPERIAEDPLVLVKFWDGISSFGGFLGGTVGVLYYLKRHRISAWAYADVIAFAFAFAWVFGRMGCTVAHDHPGLPTDFFLAVDFPATKEFEAGPRHDLGFYEFLWALALAAFFYARRNKPHFAGWHVAVWLTAYVPWRFAWDFLRTADETYLGLTPGQYAAIGLGLVAVWIWVVRGRSGDLLVPDGRVHVFPDGTSALVPGQPGPAKPTKGRKRR